MLRITMLSAALLIGAGAASADTLAVFDNKGAADEVDTAALTGCRIIFDSAGVPFEICRMKKVELTPPASTRARPGHAEEEAAVKAEKADVIYVKAGE
ncbi:hypothetical protein G5B40_11215 [Pikeienuella piscinae]|uniref:Uncharacterized protein n=1 Tax=Pikeienuella piscinae TaxID=2748098 RepID=A0A7L5BW73_9RHOB|nr:hypothetical protein [Pikeienuella piscinae]QIE55972.1 hypothetical protein G5B40_11215 [Pikeienuella piscinae]